MNADVRGCSSCGENHDGMQFTKLAEPDDEGYEYVGECPTTKQPVWMRHSEDSVCTCNDSCSQPCKGVCGCEVCSEAYGDFLSCE